jgi:hypothetical protein
MTHDYRHLGREVTGASQHLGHGATGDYRHLAPLTVMIQLTLATAETLFTENLLLTTEEDQELAQYMKRSHSWDKLISPAVTVVKAKVFNDPTLLSIMTPICGYTPIGNRIVKRVGELPLSYATAPFRIRQWCQFIEFIDTETWTQIYDYGPYLQQLPPPDQELLRRRSYVNPMLGQLVRRILS